jgi:peptide/nickel transport system substrate-binding protein
MFTQAAEDLNSVGMKIKVKTDVYALSKLANGSLTVWAAAWSSAIDPDMYQVYHKDSQATSTNNWGYSEILSDSTGLYATEKEIINDLSEAIDEGRSYLTTEERQEAYATALDLVMELAVELPTYQRVNLLVYNSSKIDASSLNLSNITAYSGLIDRIWELKLL